MKRKFAFKKEVVIGLLFAMLAVFAIKNILFIHKLADDVVKLCRESIAAGERGDWDDARRLANAAFDLWDSEDARTHAVLKHQSIENADIALAQHVGLISDENLYEAYGSFRGAAAVMQGIRDLETVRWGSVF